MPTPLKTREYWDLVESVTQGVVQEMAPEELDMLPEFVEEVRSAAYSGKESPDDPLAFGVQEFVASITPGAIALAVQAIDFILNKTFDAGVEILKDVGKERVKGMLERKRSTGSAISLTSAQLAELSTLLEAEAKRLGMKSDKARTLSQSLIGALVLKRT